MEEVYLLKEMRPITYPMSIVSKQAATTKYNKQVRLREFKLEDIVLWRAGV